MKMIKILAFSNYLLFTNVSIFIISFFLITSLCFSVRFSTNSVFAYPTLLKASNGINAFLILTVLFLFCFDIVLNNNFYFYSQNFQIIFFIIFLLVFAVSYDFQVSRNITKFELDFLMLCVILSAICLCYTDDFLIFYIAVEFQNNFPDIPLICDPSHIAGKRDLIYDLSQTSLDLNYDGLMIESHWDPDNAWSDAAQQVTPKRLIQIMKDLKIRDKTFQGEDYQNQLNNLRSQIDVADQNLLTTLGKRMEVAKNIGKLKSDNNVAILQNKRWNEILGKMILDGEDHGLSEEFILRFFKAIHQESINNQKKILKK